MAAPDALTYLYTSKEEIEDILSSEGVSLRLDDDRSGTLSAAELLRINNTAVNYASSRVNLFVAVRYQPSQLVNSWTAHRWASIIAAVWICARRGNNVPKSLKALEKKVELEMQSVHDHDLDLFDIPETESDQPVITNYTIDTNYDFQKVRREPSRSDGSPMPFTRANDFAESIVGPLETYP